MNKLQNRSLELSLLLSLPAAAALVIGSDEIVNALFGYGSFSENDIKMTSMALKYFGFGIPAFAILKIFANFFFARDNTLTPFRVSIIIVIINLIISVMFFREVGFIIIPIATTFSSWVGVGYYLFILFNKNYFKIESIVYRNLFKITLSTSIMSYIFYQSINYFSENLAYTSTYKILYLLFIVIFIAIMYFLICYLLKVLNIKKFKAD